MKVSKQNNTNWNITFLIFLPFNCVESYTEKDSLDSIWKTLEIALNMLFVAEEIQARLGYIE